MSVPDIANEWERLDGYAPGRLLDQHPDLHLVALQISSLPLDRAGTWDMDSGRLIWAPDQTIALCWMPGGHQVVLLQAQYSRSPDHPHQVAPSLETEYTYCLERLIWPPIDPDDAELEMIGTPRFLSDTEFVVTLPTGAEQRFSTRVA